MHGRRESGGENTELDPLGGGTQLLGLPNTGTAVTLQCYSWLSTVLPGAFLMGHPSSLYSLSRTLTGQN